MLTLPSCLSPSPVLSAVIPSANSPGALGQRFGFSYSWLGEHNCRGELRGAGWVGGERLYFVIPLTLLSHTEQNVPSLSAWAETSPQFAFPSFWWSLAIMIQRSGFSTQVPHRCSYVVGFFYLYLQTWVISNFKLRVGTHLIFPTERKYACL